MNTQGVREEALSWVLDKIAAKKVTTAPSTALKMPSAPPPMFQTQAQKKVLPQSVDLPGIRTKEMELWHTWKSNGMKPEHLDPLLKSLDKLVQKGMNRYRGQTEIPEKTLEYQHKKLLVKALKTYDPSKGAQLQTHITWALKKTDRFVKQHQNFARIPENVSRYIGKYNASKAELTEKLDHEPDDITLAHHSGLSLKQVKVINKSLRKGLIQSDGDDSLNLTHSVSDREMEVALNIYPLLTPEERKVHELSVGLNGHPKLKPGEIAKKLGFDGSKVSKLRRSIIEKAMPYLEE